MRLPCITPMAAHRELSWTVVEITSPKLTWVAPRPPKIKMPRATSSTATEIFCTMEEARTPKQEMTVNRTHTATPTTWDGIWGNSMAK